MHGGDIYRNQVHMDFSVNVNPLGAPETVKVAALRAMDRLDAYPDAACMALRQGLAKHFLLEENQVLCGNGASELFMAICQSLRPRTVLLPAPGFTGYAKGCKAVASVMEYELLQEQDGFAYGEHFTSHIREKQVDLMVLTNPNNPTGNLLSLEQVVEIAKTCQEVGTILVIDECFIELTEHPEYSFAQELKHFSNVLLLRAFTKSFAIPALRLGYLLGEAALLKQIEEQIPEWSVSLPAQEAGLATLTQASFLDKARMIIWVERDYLKRELESLGFIVYPSASCFLLFRGREGVYEDLLEKGILIRDCSDYVGLGRGYYRIAVKEHKDNVTLIHAMQEIV